MKFFSTSDKDRSRFEPFLLVMFGSSVFEHNTRFLDIMQHDS